MSDQPTSETLRLVEGRESNRCIVCDRYLRAGNWPGMSYYHTLADLGYPTSDEENKALNGCFLPEDDEAE